MGWIKRNLFFVVGGAVALALLGGAGFFIWQGFSRNADASNQLNELYDKLKEYSNAAQKPGDDKTDNIKLAKEQEKQVQDWVAQARQHFQPIPAIPASAKVSSLEYGDSLRHTIEQLQHAAESSSVTLPPKYQFSFTAQCSLARVAPGSLEPLAQQLGEVKAISEILFAARVNDLDSIQRVRVSEDDEKGLPSDYTDVPPITNGLAVITPYVVNFRTFTPELAKVLAGFANSPNPFIVKSVAAQPAGVPENVTAAAAPAVPSYAAYMGRPTLNGQPPQPAATSKSGLQTILK